MHKCHRVKFGTPEHYQHSFERSFVSSVSKVHVVQTLSSLGYFGLWKQILGFVNVSPT